MLGYYNLSVHIIQVLIIYNYSNTEEYYISYKLPFSFMNIFFLISENNAVKATALFHNQLKQRASAPLQQQQQQQQGLTASLQMGRPDMMRVNVIQKESRVRFTSY